MLERKARNKDPWRTSNLTSHNVLSIQNQNYKYCHLRKKQFYSYANPFLR